MDSRRDFTSKKVFSGYFSELGEKANSALVEAVVAERHVQRSGSKSVVLPEALLFQDHFDRREIPVLCLRRYFEGAADMLQVLCLGPAFKAADNSFHIYTLRFRH